MAGIKIKLDTRRKNKDGKYPLVLGIVHKTKPRIINLGIAIHPNQWNPKTQNIIGIEQSKRYTAMVKAKLRKAEKYLDEHLFEIARMDVVELKKNIEIVINSKKHTASSAIQRHLVNTTSESSLKSWSTILINRAKETGKTGTANWYRDGMLAFLKFHGNEHLLLIDITPAFLEEFKVWGLKEIPNLKKAWKVNTLSAHMRAVRAIMNQSIKEEKNYVPETFQPFKKVGIPEETIEVNSISKKEIGKLRELDLDIDSPLWVSRAYFLFMFNMQGMNFSDLAKHKKEDYNTKDNSISYYRSKTMRNKKRKQITVQLTKEALALWEHFAQSKSKTDYVFNILTKAEYPNEALKKYNESRTSNNPAVTQKNRIKYHLKKLNKGLAVLSYMIGLEKPITSYDARYGWVNAALDVGISENVIGMGMGHKDASVTRRYFEERHKKSSLGDLNELITQ